MAQIPSNIRFVGISTDVDMVEKKSTLLNRQTETYTMQDIIDTVKGSLPEAPYKVYTALLTQSGDGTDTFTSGTLDIGKTYEITTFEDGDDFTNVGAVTNETGEVFIATGTTPTTWTEGSELRDTSAPVATVLENTLGNVWFAYNDAGTYSINSEDLFIDNKTFIPNVLLGSAPSFLFIDSISTDNVTLIASEGDSSLSNATIEIRVYN